MKVNVHSVYIVFFIRLDLL